MPKEKKTSEVQTGGMGQFIRKEYRQEVGCELSFSSGTITMARPKDGTSLAVPLTPVEAMALALRLQDWALTASERGV